MKRVIQLHKLLATAALAVLLVFSASCGRKGDIIPPGSILPGQPDGLGAELKEGSVILVWGIPDRSTDGGPLDDLAGFRVYRATFSDGEDECPCLYGEVANIDIEYPVGAVVRSGRVAWSDPGTALEIGKRYSYKVAAYNTSGYNGPSVEIGPMAYIAPPPQVTGLTVLAGDRLVELSWDEAEGASGYRVYRLDGEDSPIETPLGRAPIAGGGYSDTGLDNNRVYYYAVTALAGEDAPFVEGPPSAVVSAEPSDRTAPSAPAGLVAVQGDGFVLLSWEPVQERDVTGYHIYRSAEGSDENNRLTEEPVVYITYKDDTAAAGEVYTYFVSAVDAAVPPNESPLSEPATSR